MGVGASSGLRNSPSAAGEVQRAQSTPAIGRSQSRGRFFSFLRRESKATPSAPPSAASSPSSVRSGTEDNSQGQPVQPVQPTPGQPPFVLTITPVVVFILTFTVTGPQSQNEGAGYSADAAHRSLGKQMSGVRESTESLPITPPGAAGAEAPELKPAASSENTASSAIDGGGAASNAPSPPSSAHNPTTPKASSSDPLKLLARSAYDEGLVKAFNDIKNDRSICLRPIPAPSQLLSHLQPCRCCRFVRKWLSKLLTYMSMDLLRMCSSTKKHITGDQLREGVRKLGSSTPYCPTHLFCTGPSRGTAAFVLRTGMLVPGVELDAAELNALMERINLSRYWSIPIAYCIMLRRYWSLTTVSYCIMLRSSVLSYAMSGTEIACGGSPDPV
eukprot:3941208-Rhodomonas_salina.1